MTESRGLLALLPSSSDHEIALGSAAAECGLNLVVVHTSAAAESVLQKGTTRALVVDADSNGAEELCNKARLGAFPGDLVVFVVTRRLTTDIFTRAYQWGADDVVALDSRRALHRRLEQLPTSAALPRGTRGLVLVADPDARLAARIERMLSYLGNEVERAKELEPPLASSRSERVAFVILNPRLGKPTDVIPFIRQSGSRAGLLVWSNPGDVEALTHALERFGRVAVLNNQVPVESVPFVLNQLMAERKDLTARTERRFPHSTMVAFKEAGTKEEDYGFACDVGPRGIYVRTLGLPEGNRVWVELCPPGVDQRVRLAGEVVWRRPFGFARDTIAPPGFGLQIRAGLWSDHELWLESFLGTRQAIHTAGPTPTLPGPHQVPAAREPEVVPAPLPASLTAAVLGAVAAASPAQNPPTDHPAPKPLSTPPIAAATPSAEMAAISSRAPATPSAEMPAISSRAPEPPSVPEHRSSKASPDTAHSRRSSPDGPSSTEPRDTADRWFASYVEPPPEYDDDAVPVAGVPPRPHVTVGLFVAAGSVVVVSALTAYLFARSNAEPSVAPSTTGAASTTAQAVSPPPIEPTAAPTLEASEDPAEESTPDPSSLPVGEGYLRVASSSDASVYVNGQVAGPPNQWLRVRCGFRFVRQGEEPGPRWLGKGSTVRVLCRGRTETNMDSRSPSGMGRER